MAMFSQPGNKRQKLAKDSGRMTDTIEYFPGINKVEYKGTSASFDDTLCYRYYNANERINGRTMEDWIKPALSFNALKYNGSDMYGKPTFQRTWNDNSNTVENYKRFIGAGFEFCSKLGIKYYTAFDSDFMSDTELYNDQNVIFEDICEFIQEAQQKSMIKPLWIAPDLCSNSKFASGASTSYDSSIMMQASHQVKKCLEMSQRLNAEGFLVSSPRDGYNTILNTDVQKELKHFARLLKMLSDYKDRLGFRGQLLFYPNYDEGVQTKQEPLLSPRYNANNRLKHYIYDSISGVCFLKHYNLERQYKLITNFGHQLYMTTAYNATGSIELNNNEKLYLQDAVLLMKNVVENQSGHQPGGINLKLIPNRDSVDYKDLFTTYIHHIDTLAKGLRIYVKMTQDQTFAKNIQQRYSSYYSGFGSRLSNGEATLEECEDQLRKIQSQCTETAVSSRCEHWEATFDNFISTCKLN